MVTINESKNTKIEGNKRYIFVELRGLSTDTKPTVYEDENLTSYIDNGSVFVEMDTQKIFFYDLASQEWLGEE